MKMETKKNTKNANALPPIAIKMAMRFPFRIFLLFVSADLRSFFVAIVLKPLSCKNGMYVRVF